MTQENRNIRKARRSQERKSLHALANDARRSAKVNPLSRRGSWHHASRWPVDFQEMALRISREGAKCVPNRDRDMLAKGAPTGTFTRRDGTSVWANA